MVLLTVLLVLLTLGLPSKRRSWRMEKGRETRHGRGRWCSFQTALGTLKGPEEGVLREGLSVPSIPCSAVQCLTHICFSSAEAAGRSPMFKLLYHHTIISIQQAAFFVTVSSTVFPWSPFY